MSGEVDYLGEESKVNKTIRKIKEGLSDSTIVV